MQLSRREALMTFVGVALGNGLRLEEAPKTWRAKYSIGEQEVTPEQAAEWLGLYPESCSAQDAAQVLCDLRDGIEARKIPCTDWAFSDMVKEVCGCINSYDTQNKPRNTEFVRGLIPGWLDDCKQIADKGEVPWSYGENREQTA